MRTHFIKAPYKDLNNRVRQKNLSQFLYGTEGVFTPFILSYPETF